MPRQSRAIPCLLTRPASQGDSFAAAVAVRFGDRLRLVVSPLMAPRFLTPSLPGQIAGVIFTSATGVEAFVRLIPRSERPSVAWCVGTQTARQARAAGFSTQVAEGDALALVHLIRARNPAGPLLHARGREARGEVADQLNSAGIETHQAIIYAQEPQPLTTEAQALLHRDGPVLLPLFSPRTAMLLREAAAGPSASLHAVVMSAAVADALQGLPLASLTLAVRPEAAAMLAAMEQALAPMESS
jgi:uroporphyrinogen-III synthase